MFDCYSSWLVLQFFDFLLDSQHSPDSGNSWESMGIPGNLGNSRGHFLELGIPLPQARVQFCIVVPYRCLSQSHGRRNPLVRRSRGSPRSNTGGRTPALSFSLSRSIPNSASASIGPPLEFQGQRPRLPLTTRCLDAQVGRLDPSSGQIELSAGLKARK